MIAIGMEVYKVEGSTIIKGIVENVVKSNFVLGNIQELDCTISNPTHWCKIPEPPKKETNVQ